MSDQDSDQIQADDDFSMAVRMQLEDRGINESEMDTFLPMFENLRNPNDNSDVSNRKRNFDKAMTYFTAWSSEYPSTLILPSYQRMVPTTGPGNLLFDVTLNGLPGGNMSSENIMTQLLQSIFQPQQEDVRTPMTDDALKVLPEMLYKDIDGKLEGEDNYCAICQDFDPFSDDDNVLMLPCKHYFHPDCIKPWLKEHNHTCPVCKTSCGDFKPISEPLAPLNPLASLNPLVPSGSTDQNQELDQKSESDQELDQNQELDQESESESELDQE